MEKQTLTSFLKYPHLERYGATEVQDIELGECHIFPKIDGTNASLWLNEDGIMCGGSRNRQLYLDKDNAGFLEWAINQSNLDSFFVAYPDLRLYGEWLVPHSLKTYRVDAWQRFYVFDVMKGDKFLTYEEYKPLMEEFGIDYIPPLCVIRNASYEQLVGKLHSNVFLIEDGKGAGEGIVLKRYDFYNKFGRQTWAKIVTSEFKEKHAKEMGGSILEGKRIIEEEIADKYVTAALCQKEHAKIMLETGGEWSSKMIPRLLQTVFYSLVKEECWEFVKEHKYPVIDFKRLQFFSNFFLKNRMPQLFR